MLRSRNVRLGGRPGPRFYRPLRNRFVGNEISRRREAESGQDAANGMLVAPVAWRLARFLVRQRPTAKPRRKGCRRMIHVEEVNDIDQLSQYRMLWTALLPGTRGATFFHSFDWLETYWKYYGCDQRLRVLIVTDNGDPVGILPLVVRRESTRIGSVRVLTYPLDGWGTFYGPIGPNPTATLAAGLRHIRNTPRDYDLLDLRWVDLHGSDHGRARTTMQRAGFHPCQQAWDQAPQIDMTTSWQQYWQSRRKKWRHNVDRLTRRLARQGTIRLVRHRPESLAHGDGDPRWDLLQASLKLARCSWQGASTTGTTLCHGSVCQYIRDVHATAARVGALDLALLLLDDRPIAFIYHYHYHGRIFGLRKGYDPEFASAGPGSVLQRMVLEDSFQRGDESYDLGVGSLESKEPWQTSLATSYRYTHYPLAAVRGQILRLKRWVQSRVHGPGYVVCAQTA